MPPAIPVSPISIEYSELAAEQLSKMKAAARPGSAHETAYNGVKHIIQEVIGSSAFCFMQQNCLVGDLSGVLRVKKGRIRVFYLASSKQGRAVVLLLGFRKAGDKHDAYEEFARHLRRGDFDQIFTNLGVRKPEP